ncbi:MAG: hypothetical protein GX937_07305 [Lentisphaerae bacterium]|jgi:predicted RNA-binding Zn-ribbon protein involved in translation (DUF1610 family)|nr:hypothetical protein [Lentisphaerota bacterium]HHV04791.1 hypothetical protein [Bacteroidales bacterium]
MKGFVPLPWHRRKEPVIYDVSCPQCGFAEEYVYSPHYETVVTDANAKPERTELRDLKDLPKVCPHCGTKLKTIKRRLFLRY